MFLMKGNSLPACGVCFHLPKARWEEFQEKPSSSIGRLPNRRDDISFPSWVSVKVETSSSISRSSSGGELGERAGCRGGTGLSQVQQQGSQPSPAMCLGKDADFPGGELDGAGG